MNLSRSLLNDFISILSQFGYKVNDEWHKKPERLWELIINVRENMKKEIDYTLRMNFNLCLLMEEEEQSRELNFELFRINHLLEQSIYRLDNNPEKGLKDFHKIILSTYGNINNFIREFTIIKENLSFIRKRKDSELIDRYLYLKKISLPVKGYEELRMALITILKKFKGLKLLITNPDILKEFEKEIDIFIKRYQTIYKYEHERFYKKLRHFYSQLFSLQEYKALECLSRIKFINVAYNIKPIKKYIDTFFHKECYIKNLEEILEKQVKCSCGFTPGETLSIPSLNKIKPMLRKGIKEYIEKIQNPRFKSLFNNYLAYNENSIIKNFLDLKTDNLNGNLDYIDENLVSEINRAFSNTHPLKISVEEIVAELNGTYPVTELDLLAQDIKERVMEIIERKIREMEKINYNDIIINLVN